MSYAIADVKYTPESPIWIDPPPPNTIPLHHGAFLLIMNRFKKLNQWFKNQFPTYFYKRLTCIEL